MRSLPILAKIFKKMSPSDSYELKGRGGGSRSKSQIFFVLTCLKIWNMGVQELFTEFKKIKRRPSTDVANLAPFRTFYPYNMGKWPKNIGF